MSRVGEHWHEFIKKLKRARFSLLRLGLTFVSVVSFVGDQSEQWMTGGGCGPISVRSGASQTTASLLLLLLPVLMVCAYPLPAAELAA